MSKTVTIKEEDLGAEYLSQFNRIKKGAMVACHRAALRGVSIVASATPVDEGLARSAWQVVKTKKGARLFNDAPHIGILEGGSRPHMPPIAPLVAWAMRVKQLGAFESLDTAPKEAIAMAWGVAKKISEEGTKPHYMVKNNLPELKRILKQETERIIKGSANV